MVLAWNKRHSINTQTPEHKRLDKGGKREVPRWLGVHLWSNSCRASHLLQVESSANRPTGTNPLRPAPGRVRNGHRKNGGGGQGNEDTITEKMAVQLEQPVTLIPSGVCWDELEMLHQGHSGLQEAQTHHLSPSFPLLLSPSYPTTIFDILPPAFSLYSKTDRTRGACESKDERARREVCVCQMNE